MKDLNRIDGEPMEFVWKMFPGFTTLGILEEIQCEPEQFNDRIIFMSMYNDMVWREKGNTEKCEFNSRTVANQARRFHRGQWSFLGPGSEKEWCGTYSDKLDGKWDEMAEQMMLNFSEAAHPIFPATSALERGELKSKGGGKKTIHFNGSEENIELILRTIISANQLTIYEAAADLCRELPKHSRASGKPDVNDHLETMDIPTEHSNPDHRADGEQQGNLLLEHERKIEQLSNDQKISKVCLDAGLKSVEIAGLKSVEIGQFFITLDAEEGPDEMKNLCRENTRPRNERGTVARGWIVGGRKIGPVLEI